MVLFINVCTASNELVWSNHAKGCVPEWSTSHLKHTVSANTSLQRTALRSPKASFIRMTLSHAEPQTRQTLPGNEVALTNYKQLTAQECIVVSFGRTQMLTRAFLRSVIVPSILTTLVAVLTSFGLSWVVIPPERMPAGAISTLIITPLIAAPLSFFVWWQVQLKRDLSNRLKMLLAQDHLTGLSTRSHLFERFEASPDLAGATLMIDIDHFKQINDTYGHWFGDRAIKAVADVLKKNTRRKDIVCRFGGEEFLVFLPGASFSQMEDIAQRIRLDVAGTQIDAEAECFSVTISLGGSVKTSSMWIAQAIKESDRQLYAAKESGRNRVCLAEPQRPAA